MLKINRQTDYAVRVVLALAKQGGAARISSAAIQREMQAAAERMAQTVAQVREAGQSLTDIVEGITSVNDMMSSVSDSTAQQAKAAGQVADSLQVITQVNQQTAQAAREIANTIDDLSAIARQMNTMASRFEL